MVSEFHHPNCEYAVLPPDICKNCARERQIDELKAVLAETLAALADTRAELHRIEKEHAHGL